MDPSSAGICQQAQQVREEVSPSLADKAPAVLRQYFDSAPSTFLTQHHIQSYEACLFREIPEILAAENPIVVLKEPLDAEKGVYKYKTEIFVGGEGAAQDLMLDMGAPIVTLDGGKTVRRMFPQEARMRNLTYAVDMRADVLIRLTFTSMVDGKYVSKTEEIRRDNLPLLKLPILLRSKVCATHGADTEMLREMGECPNDQGGYFIIDGSEKVLITRQEQALNSVFVARKPATDLEVATYATVVCQHPTTKRTNRVAFYRLHGKRSVEAGALRVSIPFVKGAIPLFVLFRALGVESDEDIVRMIVPLPNRAAEDSLIPCIHDAWPVTTQVHAIEYIRTLTKGFIVASVLNILHEHLFSHVPDRPLAKAQYLAEIVRKMMRVEAGQEPSTNRDDIRNQRLLPTGVLLRGLFSECWKDWKKTVIRQVDIQYNYNRSSYQDDNFLELFVPGNMPTLMNTHELNDGIMRGFRGRWGTNAFNMKSGVIQPLARISYLDAASHTRRVISDFDTSLKLTGPRQLHPSQVGYFCTSETPTGGHIGATRNMSILTAISVAADPAPLMDWLFTRGGVVEIAAAPRALAATATVVQLNGGTVGFTDKPDILTKVLKLMKWTGCLYPHVSISFNTTEGALRIYMDDGRPMRPLWHLVGGGAWPPQASASPLPSWRDLVLGTFTGTRGLDLASVAFVDPLANEDFPTLADYEALLLPHIGAVEYVDPYEGNEAYVSWWGAQRDLTKDHTHAEIHPSTLMGVLASMIPFANHNQSPRNQLSCSQSKQAIGYYATNYENRFDTYGSMLCYGEGALCRTLVHDAVAGGAMPYSTNLIFAFNSFDGYNQDDGIIFNRSSIERGLFRSLALRSYETVEEEDRISKAVYRVGNPKHVLAWTDVRAGYDYTALDDSGVIREGAVIHDKTVLVGRYMMVPETGKVIDASLLPTVFTKGRVDKVVVLHQANGLRLIKVRILEERVPELGDKFCLDDSHDVLTLGRGWVPIPNVTMDDKIAQLNRETQQMEYVHPLEVLSFDHEGEMYEVETQGVSQCVTLNHRMWVQKRNETSFGFVEAKDVFGKRVRFLSGGTPISGEDKPIQLNASLSFTDAKADAFLKLMGIWMAEGWTYICERDSIARLEIAANKERVQNVLKEVCDILDLRYSFSAKLFKWFINSKELSSIFDVWSVGAVEKSLPLWTYNLSSRQARILLESMCLGDGYEKETSLHYYTSSIKLRDDVQILAQHAGWTAYVVERYPAGSESVMKDGRVIRSTVSSWDIGIRRKRLQPTLNHGHKNEQNGQTERIIPFSGKVYCLRVPSEVFLVRRAGRCSYTGNSSRHGQKGTMGMLLDAQDMPRTAEGIVPDVMVNPHCIPSRMTMAQMLEQLFGKMGSLAGAKMNATPFMNDKQSMEAVGNALETFGFQRMGEEVMYAGTSGVMFSSSVFIGPLNFMRLKHLAQDKINARGAGRKEMRTHQPTGGRGNEGGMRIGEMERDVLIAHGITDFLTESMTKRSDGTSFWVCNGCGTIPIVNEAEGLFVCAQCDGPLQYQGVNAETIGLIMPVKKSRCTFSRVAMPYALKLLDQELTTFMNAGFRFLTSRNARGFQEPQAFKKGSENDEAEEANTGGLTAEELKVRLEAFKEMEVAAEEERDRKEAAVAKEREEAALRAWAEGEGVEDVGSYDVEGLRTLKAKKEEVEKVGPEAPEDREDEGLPARNEGEEVVAPPAGEESVDFNAKTAGFKEFDNYFAAKMTLDGKEWPTVEHYFQAAKFPSDPSYQEKIRLTKLPAGAKKLGKTEDVAMIPDWPRVREEVMMKAVKAKFQQNPKLAELLLGTGSKLIRNMAKQDNFWGVGRSGKGQNKLGKILMTVRDALRPAPAAGPEGAPLGAPLPAVAVAAAAAPVLDLPPVDPSMASFGDDDPLMGIPRFNAAAAAAEPPAAPAPAPIPELPTSDLPALNIEEFPVEIEITNEAPLALAAAPQESKEQEGGNVGKPKLSWKGSEEWQPTDSIKIIKL